MILEMTDSWWSGWKGEESSGKRLGWVFGLEKYGIWLRVWRECRQVICTEGGSQRAYKDTEKWYLVAFFGF